MTGIRRWMDRGWFGALALFLLATRFCHLRILWAEECYPAAGAIQLLHEKLIYRDFWYDKPPLTPLVYLLWGGWPGWPLRLAGTVFAVAVCWVAWRMARSLWSPREGRVAACLMAFFLTFDIPSSVTTIAPDLLMLLPHLATVWCAWRGRALAAGVLAGVCFQLNPKGLVVAAVCLLWAYRSVGRFALGYVMSNALAFGTLALSGSLPGYWHQVWQWGTVYARDTFLSNPMKEGLQRTGNWLGFHAALAIGAGFYWWRGRAADSWRTAAWALLSLAAVAGGWRFFPRYYFQLLPVMVVVAARGWTLAGKWRAAMLLALVLPAVRFGPRYVVLASDLLQGREHRWADLAMNQDSRRISAEILQRARPGDTLLVWGYRPDVWVYTRMPAGTPWLDSQPVNGVLADRHLTSARPSVPAHPEWLRSYRPRFVVDGLGPYNPALAVPLQGYRRVAATAGSVLYVSDPSSTEPASRETR